MDVKGTLKALMLEFRRELEGKYDAQMTWQAGDLERRLAAIGVRRDRPPIPVDELPHLAPEDQEARRVVDAFLQSRAEAGLSRDTAVAELVRDAAYTWANRLVALRCMEARALIDEVILQKDAYGGRSLQHNRLAKKQPERCAGEDEGLFATLFDEFARRAGELPLLFDPRAPEVALRPSVQAIKRCVALLSGTAAPKSQPPATEEVFTAPDSAGWAYQYWNTEEKDRVFENARPPKRAKITGADIIPATCIYTEPYMVKFLVQNSLGAMWMGMRPSSTLSDTWEYFVRDADRSAVVRKAVREITFLDPACGSGHFLIEAFDLLFEMYREEGELSDAAAICASIFEHNLFGIDIDERAVQIAAFALVMRAKEQAPDFVPSRVNLVATNIRLPAAKEHLDAFLRKHPEDAALRPALIAIFEGLAHADELGSLLQLEEPVEKELRVLKAKYEAAGSPAEQQTLWTDHLKPVQGKLPLGVASYEEWKERALARIREHFHADSQSSDLGAAFFGEAGAKGVSLVDMLSRRYDVVAANPPYMGSKNMGPVLKKHIGRHFASGKRDLYAAFILRCFELAATAGRVTMVMPQSWMFIRSFASLRTETDAARGLLTTVRIEALAQLGRHAFSEADPPSNVVLTTFSASSPEDAHRLSCVRLPAPLPAETQAARLRAALAGSAPKICFRPLQRRFLTIPQAPICYWLPDRLFELLAGRTIANVASVCQGLATGDDPRFVRFTWEALPTHWALPVKQRRWVPFEKGGGYGKWFGHHFWTVEWEYQGARIRQTPGPRVQNEQHYFKEGWTYSFMARGSVGFRRYPAGTIFAAGASAGVIGMPNALATAANCRFSSYVVRSISAKIQLNESYVSRIPLPEHYPDSSPFVESTCVTLKRFLVGRDIGERTFAPSRVVAPSLAEFYQCSTAAAETVAAVLHAIEGGSEREIFTTYRITGQVLQTVLDETGTPAGWFPLITGYDRCPELPAGIAVPPELLASVTSGPRRSLTADQVSDLKRRVCTLYGAGPGAEVAEEEASAATNDDDDDDVGATYSAARIPIPTETYLEELTRKLELHPISICWLLRELRERDGVICKPELLRFVEDYATVLVLRLLGHRWPPQVEVADPVPEWADEHGVIPITDGTGNPTLLVRIHERLVADFGTGRVSAVEREFEEITGKSFAHWLGSDFFKRHISQFRKRPIAWQLRSTPTGNERRRGRGTAPSTPAFSCLVYYHRLDTDLLPKLRTQYVGPVRTSLQTELGILEKVNHRTVDQDARRLELEEKLDELKVFDVRLEQVIVEGFASPAVDRIIAKERLDKWLSRDGRVRVSETRDALLAQERRYDPDLNDGVRVNIAPLQRACLLAADVIATKDIETAIADRAEWRADERRWCREGKLPQPGWWTVQSAELGPSGKAAMPGAEEGGAT
jgi:SAM-dependent methyltransferase